MTIGDISAAFARKFPGGPGDAAVHARRAAALAAFEAHGFPGRRIEDWRYTDLAPLAAASLDPAPAAPDGSALRAARELLSGLPYPPGTALAVFIDGHFVQDLSALPPTAAEQLDTTGELPGAMPYDEPAPHRALSALNEAFAPVANLQIDTNTEPKELVLAHLSLTGAAAPQPRLVLDIDGPAPVRIVQHFLGKADGEERSWTNAVTLARIGAGATLELLRVHDLPRNHALTSLVTADVERDGKLVAGTIDVGGSLTRSDLDIALREPGARADLYGLATPALDQHVDNHVSVDHAAAETNSSQTYRSIVDAGGRCVFNGKVIVRPDAQRIDASQLSDNLLLSPKAEVDTKPELEIYADDVRCSHGATVGELDDEALFYLQSRGIAASDARRILTFGFANRILKRIDDESLRRYLGARVTGSLDVLPPDSYESFEAGPDA